MKWCVNYIFWLFIASMMLIGCSTQKNTWASRSFHEMKTEYNIYFNGHNSFMEGEQAIQTANTDDYSTILNLYPVSNHEAAKAAISQMDKTIEKCRKCIKLHSIKAKPKVDYKKKHDPAYQQWLKQEEFNSKMSEAWLLLGIAEFHKGEFLGSISTFHYIIRHYENNKDMVAVCQLWVARAYGELGWLYEAEDALNKVVVDDLSRKHASLYSAVTADIKMKTKHYREAIPFIKIAKSNEKRKGNRPRFEYVLGQLYQQFGDKKEALSAYKRVIQLHPSSEMDFNARLRKAQLESKPNQAVKDIERMARLDKNKDRLDMLYGTLGDIFLDQQDTITAMTYYDEAIARSTKGGTAKASVLVKAGDICYGKREYLKAGTCYKEAVQILTAEYERFAELQHRSEVLEELGIEYTTVQLQDSLQCLAMLSEDEQRVVVDKIIEKLIKQEEAEKAKAEQEARDAENDSGEKSVNTSNMVGGGGGSSAWYFYNAQLIKNGKQNFRKQWGNRQLEDNWRRLSKTVTSTMTNDDDHDDDQTLSQDNESATPADSIDDRDHDRNSIADTPKETDAHKPEYYLQQIPKTDEDFQASNELIAASLYKLVSIYRDKLGDQAMSDEAFRDFCRRFPKDERLVDLYYMQYLTALKDKRSDDAAMYKENILTLFPESDEAKIVNQPDYFDRLGRMILKQDSLYQSTYAAYTKGDYEAVKVGRAHIEQNYPLSPLIPRFLFLDAIAQAKTDGQDAFVAALQNMVASYPEHELSAMAKDMLAMMGQGLESQKDGNMASLQEMRTQTDEETTDENTEWNPDRTLPSMVLLLLEDEKNLNRLLYEVALYNFGQFMIRDYDLKQITALTPTVSALMVSGFQTMDEAEWYHNLLQQNAGIKLLFEELKVKVICITEGNMELLNHPFSIEEYITWLESVAPTSIDS